MKKYKKWKDICDVSSAMLTPNLACFSIALIMF